MVLKKLVDSISSKLAFFPPEPSYHIRAHSQGDTDLFCEPVRKGLPRISRARASWVNVPGERRGEEERLAVVTVPAPAPTRRTILHCHGNAVDLGLMLPEYAAMAHAFNCNVVGWDYRGYGCSTGRPTPSSLCTDVGAVFDQVRAALDLQASDMVLLGQSIGSGPACALASRAAGAGVAGVVLVSPFLSGMRVLQPGWSAWPSWADAFPNHARVRRIPRPVLVVHGTRDEVVPWEQGRELCALCPHAAEPLWLEGATHDDVTGRPAYATHVRTFLDACWAGQQPCPRATNTSRHAG